MTAYHVGDMSVTNDRITCIASMSDYLLAIYKLKFSRQQRKGDRITTEVIKLLSEDFVCLRLSKWGNLSHVRFT